MSRIPERWDGANQWYFVTVVTHRRRPVFADESACKVLLGAIREARHYRPFRLAALVILPDHWHALIRPGVRTGPENDVQSEAAVQTEAAARSMPSAQTAAGATPRKPVGTTPRNPAGTTPRPTVQPAVVIEEVVGAIKKNVVRRLRMKGPTIWQPRFLDHRIRDEDDFLHHLEYIRSNPIKHGYATAPDQYAWCFIHPRPFA